MDREESTERTPDSLFKGANEALSANARQGLAARDPDRRETPAVAPRLIPTTLDKPAYLVNFPFSYTADVANNAWMTDLKAEDRIVDKSRSMSQFMQLYNYLASDGLVYILPTPVNGTLQDLVFTANLGVVLEHLPETTVAVVSNFASEPRMGETPVGERFFQAMGYDTFVPPTKFEGEAELKHLYDNVYIGGYGQRSERETYVRMESEFDMRIIKIEEVDPYLYHLDCSVFPITREDTMVCTELFEEEEIAELEKYTNIVDVSADSSYSGICNSLRFHNSILNSSHIHGLRASTDEYAEELAKNRALEDIAVSFGMEVTYFNLSEYHKGGALLSCMVMHLNRKSYDFSLM